MKPIDIVNIIFNVMLVSSFICLFFFTVGARLEKIVLEQQLQNLSSELLKDYVEILPAKIKSEINASLANVQVDTSQDAKAEQKNLELFHKVIKIISAFILICGAVCYYIIINNNLSYDEVFKTFKETLIILVFIALTYSTFSVTAALNYKTADSNYVKLTFLQELKYKLSE